MLIPCLLCKIINKLIKATIIFAFPLCKSPLMRWNILITVVVQDNRPGKWRIRNSMFTELQILKRAKLWDTDPTYLMRETVNAILGRFRLPAVAINLLISIFSKTLRKSNSHIWVERCLKHFYAYDHKLELSEISDHYKKVSWLCILFLSA